MKFLTFSFLLALKMQAFAQTVWINKSNKGSMIERVKGAAWPPKIPIANAIYKESASAVDPHFDCDDFAYAYKLWWSKNFPELTKYIWTARVHWKINEDEWTGHATNVIQVYYDDNRFPNLKFFCVVEPQDNKEEWCWKQNGTKPNIPKGYLSILAKEHDISVNEIEVTEVHNEDRWSDAGYFYRLRKMGLGEVDFTTNKYSVQMFIEQTGLSPFTMKPYTRR